jgi:hypothetical protein
MADALRRFLRNATPKLAHEVEGADNKTLLEPIAFIHALSGLDEPDQFRLSYLGLEAESKRPESLNVQSDQDGRIYLPKLGYIADLSPSQAYTLTRDSSKPTGYRIDGCQSEPSYIDMTRYCDHNPIILPFSCHTIQAAVEQEIQGRIHWVPTSPQQCGDILGAYAAIGRTWPELRALIEQHVHYVTLFMDPDLHSFASKTAHGVLFLNTLPDPSLASFAEDIIHQAAHVAFAAAWQHASPLQPGLEESPLKDWIPDADSRSLEDALHGMVTLALILGCFHSMLNEPDLQPHKHEVEGRLLYALAKLSIDIHRISMLPVFSKNGRALLRNLRAVYKAMLSQHRNALRRVDFSGQAYTFNDAIYKKHNPCPGKT